MFMQNHQFKINRRMVGLLVSVVVLVALSTHQPAARPTLAASASETWTTCVPTEVMTYVEGRRIHVRCASAVSGIRYFALGTGDAANTARVLSVITTAQVAGRTLTILYDPADLSGAQIGCLVSDCRLIRAAGFGQ